MYNGYNYYPPPSGSTATSPVFLMPYPSYHQYDPFFMTPTGMQPVDGDETSEDKTESDGAKENNQQAENVSFALNSNFHLFRWWCKQFSYIRVAICVSPSPDCLEKFPQT